MIKQGQLLIERKIISVTKISEIDYINLEKLFLRDLELFLTIYYKELNINFDTLSYGQTILPAETLNRILNSKIFKDSYKTLDSMSYNNDLYEIYSLPFLIRITIETQIKSIIGFESILKSTLSINKIIDFLIEKNNMLSIDKSALENMKKIYSWSSTFIHTGEKEPIWLILKALHQIQEIFKHPDKSSKFIGGYLNYLTVDIKVFQNKINEYLFPKQKNEITLSEISFEISNKTYDNVKKIWI